MDEMKKLIDIAILGTILWLLATYVGGWLVSTWGWIGTIALILLLGIAGQYLVAKVHL